MRVVPCANPRAKLALARFIQCWNPQLDQFVMIERAVDLAVQIITEAFLTDDDYWLQLEPMALGAKPFGLCAGQSHFIRSVTAVSLKNAHGTTGLMMTSCLLPGRLPDGQGIGQDAGHVTI